MPLPDPCNPPPHSAFMIVGIRPYLLHQLPIEFPPECPLGTFCNLPLHAPFVPVSIPVCILLEIHATMLPSFGFSLPIVRGHPLQFNPACRIDARCNSCPHTPLELIAIPLHVHPWHPLQFAPVCCVHCNSRLHTGVTAHCNPSPDAASSPLAIHAHRAIPM